MLNTKWKVVIRGEKMQKSFRIVILILLIISGFFTLLEAKNKTAELYFHRGLESYLKGDYDKTIANVEEALQFDARNTKMRAFLIKVLVERSFQLFSNKQYKDALPYLEKARWFDPDNKNVNRMYDIADKRVNPPAPQPSLPEPVPHVPSQIEAEREKTMNALLAAVQQQQEKLIDAYTYPQDILRQVITSSDKDREYLLKTIERTFREQRKISSRTFIFAIGGFIVAIALSVMLIFFGLAKISARREQILIEQQSKILNMVQQQSIALAQGSTQLRLAHKPYPEDTITPREMLNDPNPRVRSKGLEVIEAELVEEEEDSEVAERLLSPFIKEKDNRVKATAFRILHRYNPEKAMKGINDMIKSEDKWMRISGAWVLGEIPPNPEIIEILLANINDKDYHFKRRIIKALKNILDSDEKKISKKSEEKIQKAINLQYKKRWVV